MVKHKEAIEDGQGHIQREGSIKAWLVWTLSENIDKLVGDSQSDLII